MKLKDLSAHERLTRAKLISSRLIDHITSQVRRHEGNRIVVYTDTLSKQIPNSLAGNAYNDFKDSLFFFEVLRLCAMWEDYRSERESIPSVLTLLDHPDVLKLMDKAIVESWRPDYPGDDYGKLQAAAISAQLRSAIRVAGNLRASKRLRRLRDFRHTFLAHSLSCPLIDAPKYGDERRLLLVSIEIVRRVYLATHNTSFAFEISIDHARKCARQLWENCKFSIPD